MQNTEPDVFISGRNFNQINNRKIYFIKELPCYWNKLKIRSIVTYRVRSTRREVIFTDRVRSTREGYVLIRVCPSVSPQGTSTWPGGVPQSGLMGGGLPQPGPAAGWYPSQVQWWGVPWPGPARGISQPGLTAVGTLARPSLGGGYPTWLMGHPQPGLIGGTQGGVPCSRDGVPLVRSDGGSQGGVPPWHGYPLAGDTLLGVPPSSTGQQMEYLICHGQYASCIHTGGLSCFTLFVSPHPGGVPWPGPARGYPAKSSQGGTSAGGIPAWGTPCWGRGVPWFTPCQGWGTHQPGPEGRGARGSSYQGWGTPRQVQTVGEYPPPSGRCTPRYRTTDGVLDTPRSVCLLRSRRRTFLLN